MADSLHNQQSVPDTSKTQELRLPVAGDVVGAYRLVRLVGQGAAGLVFEVEHTKIGRRAAMKILLPEVSLRPGAVKRLMSEAQAVNQINHPHIVEITDVVESPTLGGTNAIVMELLDGEPLSNSIVREGRLPPERFIPILIRVADALAAAHGAGFVHRDLKPENIFLTEKEGRRDFVKLLDFGIAKSLAADASHPAGAARSQHATVEGTFLGTPAYASPEQISGKNIDNRTDLYSLGVIIYELSVGRLPFEGESMGEFLVKHVTMPPPKAPPEIMATELGRSLDRIARKCLEKDPAARYRSAAEIKAELEQLFEGEMETASRLSAPRTKKTLMLAAGGGVLVVGLLLFLVTRPAPAPPVAAKPAGTTVVPLRPTAPPPVARVTVDFNSTPPGAEVRDQATQDLLGLTPFKQSFESQTKPLAVVFQLPNFRPFTKSVSLANDATVNAALEPEPKAPPTTRARPEPQRKPAKSAEKQQTNKAGTIDPFAR